MKVENNPIRKTLYFCFFFLLAVFVFLSVLSYYGEPIEPVYISINDAHLCSKESDGFVQVDYSYYEDDIYICSNIQLSQRGSQKQIQLFVVEEDFKTYKDNVFYDNLWVSSGEISIPINIYLPPGNYKVHIFSERRLLSDIQLDIIE